MIPLLWMYLSKYACHSLNHQCWGTQCMKNRKSWFSCSPHISPRNRSDDQIEAEVRANRRFKVTVQINSKQPEPFYFLNFSHILSDYSYLGLMAKDAFLRLSKWKYNLHIAKWTGFPGGSVVKESVCQCRRHGFDPWVRKIPWRRKWQPTPVFLPGKSHGQRSLEDYSPWGCKESDMT